METIVTESKKITCRVERVLKEEVGTTITVCDPNGLREDVAVRGVCDLEAGDYVMVERVITVKKVPT